MQWCGEIKHSFFQSTSGSNADTFYWTHFCLSISVVQMLMISRDFWRCKRPRPAAASLPQQGHPASLQSTRKNADTK